MKLIKEKITLPVTYSVNAEDEEFRNQLALRATSVHAVTCTDDNERAGEMVREIRSHIKSVELTRQALTKPLLDAQRLLKSLADDHCQPLIEEQQRIERLAVGFAQSEQRRVAREEAERRAAYEKAAREQQEAEEKAAKAAARAKTDAGLDKALKAEEKAVVAAERVAEVIAAPMPVVSRVKGQQTKKVLKWEVTDIQALVKARPDLCNIQPKPSAINAVCIPEMPDIPPGLKLWWEDQVVFAQRPNPFGLSRS